MKLSNLIEGYLATSRPAQTSAQRLFEGLPGHIPIVPEKSMWTRHDGIVWREFEFANWEYLSSFVSDLLSLIPMFSPKRKIDVEISENIVIVKIHCDKFTSHDHDEEVARTISSLKNLQDEEDDDSDFI